MVACGCSRSRRWRPRYSPCVVIAKTAKGETEFPSGLTYRVKAGCAVANEVAPATTSGHALHLESDGSGGIGQDGRCRPCPGRSQRSKAARDIDIQATPLTNTLADSTPRAGNRRGQSSDPRLCYIVVAGIDRLHLPTPASHGAAKQALPLSFRNKRAGKGRHSRRTCPWTIGHCQAPITTPACSTGESMERIVLQK